MLVTFLAKRGAGTNIRVLAGPTFAAKLSTRSVVNGQNVDEPPLTDGDTGLKVGVQFERGKILYGASYTHSLSNFLAPDTSGASVDAVITRTLAVVVAGSSRKAGSTAAMRHLTALGAVAGLLALLVINAPLHGQSVTPTVLMIAERALSRGQSDAVALDEVRGWDQMVTELQRTSRLRRMSREADRLVRGRTFERFDQMHHGVRVFGADVTRQTNEFGQAVSVFGTIYEAIAVDTAPEISAAQAARLLASAGNGVFNPESEQELVVLPLDGGARLTWTARVFRTSTTMSNKSLRRRAIERSCTHTTTRGRKSRPRRAAPAWPATA